jgi:hypothetical protein
MTHGEEMKTALLKTRGEDISALALLMAEFANSCCYRSDGFEEAAKAFAEDAIRKAVAAEREACAKVCESLFDHDDDSCNEAEKCAAAIRMRSN